ncbi:transporter substrate-binding domain-containing protein [Schlegelella sp. S2-27]|uniref:Transporter substrate-binding domain-containing protein n=1 Tax=Caldimonas mangrovi TaxID=2944811 RepID=A0ABT0YIT5_9BURK|nr:transporter substrate-binding domain-containing protein [Caldimonas mangrovi]MCM5678620.1 transporter substrate-binding domain-containing protein [Caldimonas mangrovi]
MKKPLLVLAAALLAAGAAQADTLKKIKETGKVVMGVRESSSPLSFTLGGGKYAGYHVELCERIIGDIGKQLGTKPAIEYTPVTSQNRIPLVQNGTVDIECGSTTNNETRQQQVAFGLTTYVTEVRMAVNKKSGIKSIADLKNKTVVTTTGTTSVQHLRKHKRGEGVEFREIYGKDHADSFLILESGRADAFVMDDNLLAGNIANAKNPGDFAIVGEVLSVEPIAIMIRKDDPAFKKAVDDSIRAAMKSGELNKLYAKWFTQPIPPKNVSVNLPMGDTLKALVAEPNDKPMEAYAAK